MTVIQLRNEAKVKVPLLNDLPLVSILSQKVPLMHNRYDERELLALNCSMQLILAG